jgi:hypothetical protein
MAHDAAVGIDDGDGVVVRGTSPFEERHGQHQFALPGDLLHALDGRLLVDRMRQVEVFVLFVDAEVRRFEQFLKQDDLCSLVCRLVHERFCSRDIGFEIPAAAHLGTGDVDSHTNLHSSRFNRNSS